MPHYRIKHFVTNVQWKMHIKFKYCIIHLVGSDFLVAQCFVNGRPTVSSRQGCNRSLNKPYISQGNYMRPTQSASRRNSHTIKSNFKRKYFKIKAKRKKEHQRPVFSAPEHNAVVGDMQTAPATHTQT